MKKTINIYLSFKINEHLNVIKDCNSRKRLLVEKKILYICRFMSFIPKFKLLKKIMHHLNCMTFNITQPCTILNVIKYYTIYIYI